MTGSGSRSPRELRRFGLTVGTAFAVLGAVSWWRGHTLPPRIMWSLAALLIASAALAPSLLGPVERRWLAMARVIGAVNARIFLTVLFYGLVLPIGAVRRWMRDPLDRRFPDDRPTFWTPCERRPVDPAAYDRQF